MPRVAIALNKVTVDDAMLLAHQLRDEPVIFKIQDLLIKEGIEAIGRIKGRAHPECQIFCDLKFKDIPSTVETMVKLLAEQGADLITVHADGGIEMVKAAVKVADDYLAKIIVVTVLTSDEPQPSDAARFDELSMIASAASAHGVTCPVQFLARHKEARKFLVAVTPGVRLPGDPANDQKSVGTPDQVGLADIVVVGRPIVNAENRVAAYRRYRDALQAK